VEEGKSTAFEKRKKIAECASSLARPNEVDNGTLGNHGARAFLDEAFDCPLCKETMKDAVITQNGNSYCGACIQGQFRKRKMVDGSWQAKGITHSTQTRARDKSEFIFVSSNHDGGSLYPFDVQIQFQESTSASI
jgi:hypothetical protein